MTVPLIYFLCILLILLDVSFILSTQHTIQCIQYFVLCGHINHVVQVATNLVLFFWTRISAAGIAS